MKIMNQRTHARLKRKNERGKVNDTKGISDFWDSQIKEN
jgi:hypothetical protein